MDLDVAAHISGLTKSFPTFVTVVWLQFVMNGVHVDSQRIFLNESLSTMGTDKVFDKQMSLQMSIQQLFGSPKDQTI